MRVVVAGGSGLIGRELVRSLGGDGHQVVVLSRRPENVSGLPPTARAVAWDGERMGPWIDELTGSDAVIQLAGEGIAAGLWTAARRQRLRASRVVSSRLLAEAAAAAKPPPSVFLQGSAVGFYGDRGSDEVDEWSRPGTGFLAEVCDEWERASELVEREGVRRPILRTGLVLAAGGGLLPVMARPFRLYFGGPMGTGRQWMPWIHLHDEVAAIRFLLAHEEATGPFSLAAPAPVTNGAFSRALAAALGRPCWLRTPTTVIHLAGAMGRELLLAGQKARPSRLLELGFEFRYPELGGALEELLGGGNVE